MELFDFDGMFEKNLARYMREHAGEYTEEEWEQRIPKLYQRFGDTYIKSANATPRGYYAAMGNGELVASLARHIKEGVPVSDFLLREIESRRPKELSALFSEVDERVALAALPLAGDDGESLSARCDLLAGSGSNELKDAVFESLAPFADRVKERAISLYRAGGDGDYLLELLSRCKARDERIFEILVNEFRCGDDLTKSAGYLARYGDERALPLLKERIEDEDLNYLEFRELRYAVEALGGEYARPRDFSEDKAYLELARKTAEAEENKEN